MNVLHFVQSFSFILVVIDGCRALIKWRQAVDAFWLRETNPKNPSLTTIFFFSMFYHFQRKKQTFCGVDINLITPNKSGMKMRVRYVMRCKINQSTLQKFVIVVLSCVCFHFGGWFLSMFTGFVSVMSENARTTKS